MQIYALCRFFAQPKTTVANLILKTDTLNAEELRKKLEKIDLRKNRAKNVSSVPHPSALFLAASQCLKSVDDLDYKESYRLLFRARNCATLIGHMEPTTLGSGSFSRDYLAFDAYSRDGAARSSLKMQSPLTAT